MPLIEADTISGMIGDLGDPVTIDGQQTTGIFYEPGKQVPTFEGTYSTSGPILLVDAATGSAIDGSTVIIINGIEYRAVNTAADRAGWYTINLTKDF